MWTNVVSIPEQINENASPFIKGVKAPMAYTIPMDKLEVGDTFYIPDNDLDKRGEDYLIKKAAQMNITMIVKKEPDLKRTMFHCLEIRKPVYKDDIDKTIIAFIAASDANGTRYSEILSFARSQRIKKPELAMLLNQLVDMKLIVISGKSTGNGRPTRLYKLYK